MFRVGFSSALPGHSNVDSSQVVGEGELIVDLAEAAGSQPAHDGLLFEDFEDRFHDGFSSGLGGSSGSAVSSAAFAYVLELLAVWWHGLPRLSTG